MSNQTVVADDFRNESGLQFTDISSEAVRNYHYAGGEIETIEGPLLLNVSRSGGHRVFDNAGVCHYISKGWRRISWVVKEGEPHFVK